MATSADQQALSDGPPQSKTKIKHHNNTTMQSQESRYSKRYIRTCLLGYSLSFIIFGSQVSILGPTIKPLAERLQVSETDLSPLFTALGIASIVSGTPSGWLVEKVPTHHVLVGSLLVEAAGFALVPLMPTVWSLTALFFVISFSYNFTNSAVFTSLGWMFPKKSGSALNLVLAMFGVGSFCIPLAAQICKHYAGDALGVFWVVGAVSLVSALPCMLVSSPAPPILELNGASHNPFVTNNKIKYISNVITASVVSLVFFTMAAETAVGNWIYTYSVRDLGLSENDAAVANAVFWGAFTAGRVLGAAVAHLTTPATLLLSVTPLAVAGCALPLIWSSGWALSARAMVMSASTLAGLGNSLGYANAVSLLSRYVPLTGFINGMFGAVAGGACMVGPTMVAWLARHTHLRYSAMAWVGLVFYALHIPAILLVLGVGRKLLALQAGGAGDEEAAEEGGQGFGQPATGGLTEPLLGVGVSSTPDGASSMERRTSLPRPEVHSPVFRTSIPGHASPLAGGMPQG